jgi:transcriptional regulator with XRE-family HTH domain
LLACRRCFRVYRCWQYILAYRESRTPATINLQHRMAFPSSRLRAYRKSAGLSQQELAVLLGLRSQGLISQFESAAKRPGIEALIACGWMFDTPLKDIFPELHRAVERDVAARARDLMAERLRCSPKAGNSGLSQLITRLSAEPTKL